MQNIEQALKVKNTYGSSDSTYGSSGSRKNEEIMTSIDSELLSPEKIFGSESSIAAMMRLCNELNSHNLVTQKCTDFHTKLVSNPTLTNGGRFDMTHVTQSSLKEINLTEIDSKILNGIVEGILNRDKLSFEFNKDRFEKAFEAELRKFGIKVGATNRLKNLLESRYLQADFQLNPRHKRNILYELNSITTADLYKFKLQNYFDRTEPTIDCFYSSRIQSSLLIVNDDKICTPIYAHEEIERYIQKVLFPCFSNYLIKKGIVNDMLIYSYFIRFGCISNPAGNILGEVFLKLNRGTFYLVDGNTNTAIPPLREKNIFSTTMPVTFSSLTYYNFMDNIPGSTSLTYLTSFFLRIDYGSIATLNGLPYKYIVSTLLYMIIPANQNDTYDYAKTQIMAIQDSQDIAEQRQLELEEQKRRDLHEWFRMREQLDKQGGNIQKKQSHSKKSKPKNIRKSKPKNIRKSKYNKHKCGKKTHKKYCKNKTKKKSK